MPENNITKYVDYFRQLAVRHKDVRHDVLTEEGKGNTVNRGFGTFLNNDLITGLNYQLAANVILAELYDESGNGANIYDIRQQPKGAFMIICKGKENNFADMLRAYADAEKICYDILKQLYADHAPGTDACNRPFRSVNFSYDKIPTGKLFTSYYGFYVQFDFEFSNSVNITTPPEEGTFI